MTRIHAVDPTTAEGKSKTLLDAVQKKLGRTPNMTRVMAQSPAVLESYLAFSGALASGSLSAKVREQIALTVAEANACNYCLSAHTAIGGMVGLKADAIADARSAKASEPKVHAILALARSIVVAKGKLDDRDLSTARNAGLTDGEILEVTGNVVLNILTNYVNHVADPEIDFPAVHAGAATTAR